MHGMIDVRTRWKRYWSCWLVMSARKFAFYKTAPDSWRWLRLQPVDLGGSRSSLTLLNEEWLRKLEGSFAKPPDNQNGCPPAVISWESEAATCGFPLAVQNQNTGLGVRTLVIRIRTLVIRIRTLVIRIRTLVIRIRTLVIRCRVHCWVIFVALPPAQTFLL